MGNLSLIAETAGTLAHVGFFPPRFVTRLGLLLDNPMETDGKRGLLETVSAIVSGAEQSGFDSFWLSDRVRSDSQGEQIGEKAGQGTPEVERPHDRHRPGSPYEAYSLLGALATRTSRIRLGAVPMQAEARAPSVLSKIVTAVDVISHGRGVLTLGVDPDATGVSGVERLKEQLRICRAMLDDDSPAFEGKFYRDVGAVNRPRPEQAGGVPIVVHFDGAAVLPAEIREEALGVAATLADALIVTGDAGAVAETSRLLGSARRPDGGSRSSPGSISLPLIWSGTVAGDNSESSLTDGSLSSSPESAAEQMRELVRSGADGCILSLVSSYDTLGTLRHAARLRALWD